jgi:hypothetical protein
VPTLSAADNAAIRATVGDPSIDGEQVVDLYRSPAAVGNKTGAPVLHTAAIPCRIRPAGDNPRLIARAQPVNAVAVEHVAKFAAGADIRAGDELRDDTKRYKVEGVGRWTNAVLVALTEIKGTRSAV